MNLFSRILAVSLCAIAVVHAQSEADESHTLITSRDLPSVFNGKNLDGWIKRGGKATYAVEDGVIVGTCSVKGGGNTFLCTEKEYGDFILELEIKADNGLNSGVQIRSHCFETNTTYDFGNKIIKIPADRVHGYQVEVDHQAGRRWSGGIYDEARRGWLNPLATNSPAGLAFKIGEWNKYRIECRGPSIKTWVNDIPAADLVDAETLKGFIGLQVHSADKPEYQVRFRNVRLQDLGKRQWQTAWDCSSFEGTEKQGAAKWALENGILHASHSKDETQSGSLLGGAAMSDFTIRFKYKLVNGEFALAFYAPEGEKTKDAFNIPFAAQMGATNFAKVQDWNTVTVSVRKQRVVSRVVSNLNGHQLKDSSDKSFPPAVRPAFVLSGGKEADVYFKDFEILESAQ